jgi:hypothetical protein
MPRVSLVNFGNRKPVQGYGPIRIFAAPLFLAVLTTFGLTAALIGEGAWHVAAWLALLTPLATAVAFLARAR